MYPFSFHSGCQNLERPLLRIVLRHTLRNRGDYGWPHYPERNHDVTSHVRGPEARVDDDDACISFPPGGSETREKPEVCQEASIRRS